jgi:hypothetical protein
MRASLTVNKVRTSNAKRCQTPTPIQYNTQIIFGYSKMVDAFFFRPSSPSGEQTRKRKVLPNLAFSHFPSYWYLSSASFFSP